MFQRFGRGQTIFLIAHTTLWSLLMSSVLLFRSSGSEDVRWALLGLLFYAGPAAVLLLGMYCIHRWRAYRRRVIGVALAVLAVPALAVSAYVRSWAVSGLARELFASEGVADIAAWLSLAVSLLIALMALEKLRYLKKE